MKEFSPSEVASDRPTFKFYRIRVVVHTPGFSPDVIFKRNVPMWNPLHALDFALRDIKKINPSISYDNLDITIDACYTKIPENVSFDPDNPED